MKRLLDLEQELREKYFNSLIGEQLEVLVEKSKPIVEIGQSVPQTLHRGTSCRYGAVEFTSADQELESRLVKTIVHSATSDRLLARQI